MKVLRESTVSDFNQHFAGRTILTFNLCNILKAHITVNEYCRIFSFSKNTLVHDLNGIFLLIFLSQFISIFKEQFLAHVFKIFVFFKIFHVRSANFHSVGAFLLIQKPAHDPLQNIKTRMVSKTLLRLPAFSTESWFHVLNKAL